MRRVLWSRPARDDVIAILDYYDRFDPALAGAIADRIEAGPDPLLTQPEIGSSVEDGPERKWRIRKTPLILLYIVQGETIEVKRVVDARSDWKRQ